MKLVIFFTLVSIALVAYLIPVHKHGNQRYYLDIPDSPSAKAWLEIDYISNDTVFCNWYATGIKTKL